MKPPEHSTIQRLRMFGFYLIRFFKLSSRPHCRYVNNFRLVRFFLFTKTALLYGTFWSLCIPYVGEPRNGTLHHKEKPQVFRTEGKTNPSVQDSLLHYFGWIVHSFRFYNFQQHPPSISCKALLGIGNITMFNQD